MNANVIRGLVAAGALAVVGGANAAAVEVTSLTTDLAAQAAPVAAVGLAVLLIYGGVKAFKFIRAAMG